MKSREAIHPRNLPFPPATLSPDMADSRSEKLAAFTHAATDCFKKLTSDRACIDLHWVECWCVGLN